MQPSTLEDSLRRFINHPKKQTFVIIITLAVAFILWQPPVDKYFALSAEEEEQRASIEDTQLRLQSITQLRQTALKRDTQLKEAETKVANSEEVRAIRDQLVQWVQDIGCSLRDNKLDPAREREWVEGDNPIALTLAKSNATKTNFTLRQQALKLSVSGEPHQIQDLLARISAMEKAVHTAEFSIRPMKVNAFDSFSANESEESSTALLLDMTIVLFNLKTKPVPPAA